MEASDQHVFFGVFSTCWRWRCQTFEEVWNISTDRPSDPVIHPWAFTNNPHQCKSDLNQFCPMVHITFTRHYQGINQHCIHSLYLVGPLWNPKGTGFYKQPTAASVKSWRMMWITTLLPPQGLLPTQLAILHEDEDAHPYHAVHVRWGPNPQGFFRQRGFGNMPDEGKGCDIQCFLWGWCLYAQISWHFIMQRILGSGPCSLPECLWGRSYIFLSYRPTPTVFLGWPTIRGHFFFWSTYFLVERAWNLESIPYNHMHFLHARLWLFLRVKVDEHFQFDLARLHPVAYLQPS